MDLRFARSRRRVAARRSELARRPPRARRPAYALLVAGGVFALAGGIVAEAQTPVAKPRDSGRPAAQASCPIPRPFRAAFARAALETGVPLPLLVALAQAESSMNPTARSHAGAEGLLQLMPATARELALDATVPRANVLGGARYLQRMLERFDGDVRLALAAYNAGPSAVERAGGAPSRETHSYVLDVEARAASLGSCR